MGYTHYWRRVKIFECASFKKAVQDFTRLLGEFERIGVVLAGPDGEGQLEISPQRIAFNGVSRCGHMRRELGITWPAKSAGGTKADGRVTGSWLAGSVIESRTCDGDCSHESFVVESALAPERWEKPEHAKYFYFCKTAYKPYDLAVTAALIILKHHLGSDLLITSDGYEQQWFDAKLLCHGVLGYGLGFRLDQ